MTRARSNFRKNFWGYRINAQEGVPQGEIPRAVRHSEQGYLSQGLSNLMGCTCRRQYDSSATAEALMSFQGRAQAFKDENGVWPPKNVMGQSDLPARRFR